MTTPEPHAAGDEVVLGADNDAACPCLPGAPQHACGVGGYVRAEAHPAECWCTSCTLADVRGTTPIPPAGTDR